jgi:hypothetical protein
VKLRQGHVPVAGAAGLPLLAELRLAGDRLAHVTDVRVLAVLSTLQRLTLTGNPVVDGLPPRAAAALVRNACPGETNYALPMQMCIYV